jgi:hypothetical protein
MTTQRCMRLSPSAIEGAVRLLEQDGPPQSRRVHEDILETPIAEAAELD